MRDVVRTYGKAISGFFLLVLVLGAGFVISGDEAMAYLELVRDYPVVAPLLYILFVITSVVAAPFAALPLIPFATSVWGIPLTATMNVLGWWIGAIIAFEVSRRFGRPIASYFASLQRIDAIAAHISGRETFTSIVLLRMILPVEVPSYALGLINTVKRTTHATASLIGIIPFAILITVMGRTLMTGQWALLSWLFGLAVVLFLVAWYVWRHVR